MAVVTGSGLRVGEYDARHRGPAAEAVVVPARAETSAEARELFEREGAVVLRRRSPTRVGVG